jgi:hypothetical protein
MKEIFGTLTIGLFVSLSCTNPRTASTVKDEAFDSIVTRLTKKGDTLIIVDSNNISDPFAFGDKPLKHLLKIGGKPTFMEAKDYADTIQNDKGEFVLRTLGSIHRLKYDENYFQMYRRADSVEFFLTAEMVTNKFPNKWGVEIGMTKEEIVKKLSQFKITEIPTTLIIGDLNYTFIQFDFENDRLKKIKFDFYID